MQRRIALVDCNNFYVSCERLFQPDLIRKPVVVLSNNDGCVVSRSAEAKQLGIKMAVPWHQIRSFAKQHGIVARSSNYSLYADISNRVMHLLAGFSPTQEIYSIDECFLDMDGMTSRQDLSARAQQIRQTIRQCTGIPTCVGIASSKTLAKLANHIAKTQPALDGVCDLNATPKKELESLFANLPVGEVWGIGHQNAKRLQQIGISSVLNLKRASGKQLRSQFGVIMERIVAELNGSTCLELDEIKNTSKKQIICSRSFGTLINSLADMEQAAIDYTSRAAEKLRRQHSVAHAIHVYIRTNPNQEHAPQHHQGITLPLPEATADTRILCRAALSGLRQIYKSGFAYQKVGITLSDLWAATARPCSLFDDLPSRERSEKLMRTMDQINFRMGSRTVHLLGEGINKGWSMRREHMSRHYTTQWDELAIANCN